MGSSTVVRCSYFNVSRDNLMNYLSATDPLTYEVSNYVHCMYKSAVTCMASTCAPLTSGKSRRGLSFSPFPSPPVFHNSLVFHGAPTPEAL